MAVFGTDQPWELDVWFQGGPNAYAGMSERAGEVLGGCEV